MIAESQEALQQLQRTHNGVDPAAAAAAASDDTELRQLKEEVAVLHRVVAGEERAWLWEFCNWFEKGAGLKISMAGLFSGVFSYHCLFVCVIGCIGKIWGG